MVRAAPARRAAARASEPLLPAAPITATTAAPTVRAADDAVGERRGAADVHDGQA